MKVYKVEVMVIDFDGVGDGIKDAIEHTNYPNDCIIPFVMGMESVDIGEWDDDHPLNNRNTQKDEFNRIFNK